MTSEAKKRANEKYRKSKKGKETEKRCRKRAHKRKKIFAIKYKGGKCCKCGYNKNRAALEFHHRNKKEKDSIKFSHLSKAKLIKELEKCDLLCSNCHKELHHPDCAI